MNTTPVNSPDDIRSYTDLIEIICKLDTFTHVEDHMKVFIKGIIEKNTLDMSQGKDSWEAEDYFIS